MLEFQQPHADEVGDIQSKALSRLTPDVLAQEIETCLIHADNADRGKMIFPVLIEFVLDPGEIVFRVRVEVCIGKGLQDLSLDFQAGRGEYDEIVESFHKIDPIRAQKTESRQVDGNNADGSGERI